MSKSLVLIAAAIVLAGCAGNSTQPAADDNSATAAEESGKPKVKCKYVRSTSSRVGEKVCEKVPD